MSRFAPADLDELRDAIGEALAVEEPLEVVAGGSKRGLGRPLQLPRMLDLSRLAGIRDYQPSELVLTAGAATPIEEIDAALAEAGQMLAFEPPDLGALFGLPASVSCRRTLGGALACNLSGPRRIKVGAARDHFLGFRGVSGRGEVFKAGGKVVKNVTGYDLCKLMAGSFGTLAVLEEVTIKVLPRPEAVSTVMFWGLVAPAALRILSRALASPHEVSGAVYIPAHLTAGLMSPSASTAIIALRLEGPHPSVIFRGERLLAELGSGYEASSLDDEASIAFWRAVRDILPLAGFGDHAIWRVSVAPSRGGELGEALAHRLETSWYLDWAGGLVWVAIAGAEDGGAAVIRHAIRGADGRGTGHATLIKGSPELRRSVPVFEPLPPPLAALAGRIKEGFDPRRILNPGRMAEGF
ncbi:MAG: glycolate oxidase subunit GlcE [Stellaceae bacterium]